MDHKNAYELGPPTPSEIPKTKARVTEHFELDKPITREGVMHALEVCVADKDVVSIHVEKGIVTVERVVPTDIPPIPGPEASGLSEEAAEFAMGNITLEEIAPTGDPLHDLLRASKILSERGLLPRYLLLASGDYFAYSILTLNTGHILGTDVFRTTGLSPGVGVLLGTPTFRCDIISAEYGVRITVDEPIKEIGED